MDTFLSMVVIPAKAGIALTRYMKRNYFVYILTNKPLGVFNIGVSNNLSKRTYEHKNHLAKGFTSKYNLDKLIYYEIHEEIEEAILREKRLKKWNRSWKIRLIEKTIQNRMICPGGYYNEIPACAGNNE